MTPWGREFLRLLQEDQKISLRDFALKVKAKHSHLSEMVNGKAPYKGADPRKPPLSKISEWADALELEGAERDHFIELAELEHTPERIARRYLAQQARIRSLEERVTKLEKL
jgi:transcriptional regulator with XRE-family HTH domain